MWIKDVSLVDIIERKECFLNLNFISIALYNKSDPEFLYEFLSMDRAKLPARHVRGDPRCVSLDDIDMTYPMNICLNSKSEAKQIIEAINFFAACRNNINSKKIRYCPEMTTKLFNLMKNSTKVNSRLGSLFKINRKN